ENVCRQLLPGLDDEAARRSNPRWQDVFHKRHIDHVILYDPDPTRLRDGFDQMSRNASNWRLLSVSGHAVVFGWLSAETSLARTNFSKLQYNAAYEAYGARSAVADDTLAAVPRLTPESTRKPTNAWAAFGSARRSAWESTAADLCLRTYDSSAIHD